MHKSMLFICLWLMSFHLFAQESLTLESSQMEQRLATDRAPMVKVNILNYDHEADADLQISYYIVQLSSSDHLKKTGKIASDGTSELQMEYALPYQQIWFSIGTLSDRYFYGSLLVHEGVEIIADLDQLKAKSGSWVIDDGISFKGPDKEVNTFINQYYQFASTKQEKLNRQKNEIRYDRKLSAIDQVEKIRELYVKYAEIDEAFLQLHPSPFAWILENERLCDMYGNFLVRFWSKDGMPEDLWQEILNHKPALVSNSSSGYYNYLATYLQYPHLSENIELNKKTLSKILPSQAEKDTLNMYLEEYHKRMNREEANQDILAKGTVKYINPNKELLDAARLDLQVRKLSHLSTAKRNIVAWIGQPDRLWEREKYLKKVIPLVESPWYNAQLQAQLKADENRITSLNEILAEENRLDISHPLGTKVLEIENTGAFYMADHEDPNALIEAIRNTHKDTAIIVDIWTTWCGPCLHDMRNSKGIKKELQNLPVKVVYLCMENGTSNPEDWTSLIAEMELKGDHIFVPKKLSDQFLKSYEVKGFPTVIFFDKEGVPDKKLIPRVSMLDLTKVTPRL